MAWGTPDITGSTGTLLTASAAADFIGITDQLDDDFLETLIDQAIEAIGSVVDIPTYPKASEARNYHCSNTLVLLDECLSITGVTDNSGRTLGYEALSGRRPGDFLRGVVLDSPYDGWVIVNGEWGYAHVPDDLKRALLICVSTWYKRSRNGTDADVVGGLSMLPKEARDYIDAHRQVLI